MTGNEIRELFLEYFEREGHTRVASSPLLPANDPTLLFANAGMNQFKDVFTGAETRPYTRACSSQKCIRAGGKHNDLDDVGKTARHQTFFEMLGNFSFGEYFKRDAIRFAWELLLDVYKLPLERLWVSVYEEDEEAERLWIEQGMPPERIVRFGAKDNFWQMGDTGPCGPCSEIHYYRGESPEDPTKNRADMVGNDTTLEFYNLVFMEYDRAADGSLTPLPKPSVDTGLGLERLTAILQNAPTNYDTDLFRPLIDFTGELAGKPYVHDSPEGFSMRVIADHARATAFAIADGILPGNEGRNYVLRKIMRRAIYHGRNTLGLNDLFFYKVTDKVVEQMRGAYPELEAARSFVERMVKLEEERFASTLEAGQPKLDAYLATLASDAQPDFKELARLYDTFGYPRDLIRVQLEERGFIIKDEEFYEHFEVAMREMQKHVFVEERGFGTDHAYVVKGVDYKFFLEDVGQSEFVGYDSTRLSDARVLSIIRNIPTNAVSSGKEPVGELGEGDEGEVILASTPFYAESGGQVGDTGTLINGNAHVVVNDTVAPIKGLTVHRVKVEHGSLRVGDTVTAQVDAEKRDSTRRNHTATHLLHAALREVLGTHVKQAGSLVAPNRLRFDFTHFQPLARDEVAEIERIVNNQIMRNTDVSTDILPIEEAMRSGAMALFGEKYGERVRVLTIPDFSKELCGGTHVHATGDIGLFKVVRDEAVASGTRRIEAVTGADAFTRFQETEALVDSVAGELRTNRQEIPAAVERLQEELKRARREAEELRLKLATGAGGTGDADERRTIGDIEVLAREASDLDAAALRQLSDALMSKVKRGVVVLGRRGEGKASLIVRTSPDVRDRVQAGAVIRELAPIIGGRGGGRPDMAEGGGAQADKLPEALQASYEVIERLLGQV